MAFVIGLLALLFLGALVGGARTGRINLKSCCAVGDARRDLRMRAAYDDEAAD